jgi:broad specificity phosphatase PhoE
MRERIRKGRDQADRAYHRYFKPPANGRECEILVSHGNVIRYLVGRALGMSERSWYGLGTSLCGITVVRVLKTGACVLERYNDTGHLTPDLV